LKVQKQVAITQRST